MTSSIGIIGVGELAGAIVDGLRRAGRTHPQIWLSPRGEAASAELARRYAGVAVSDSNHQVAERVSLLLLTVPPGALRESAADLRLTAEHVVVSALAGVSHGDLRAVLGPACTIVRAIPLPAVRSAAGSITVVYPPADEAVELFDELGGTLPVHDDATFAALAAATGTISTFLSYVAAVAGWLAAQGLEPEVADRYVRGVFEGVCQALADPAQTTTEIATSHETPGGLNEQLRRDWFDDANRARLERGLDALVDRMRDAG